MRGQPAKVLSEADLRRLMKVAAATAQPPRSQAMILLTVKAGLRACEVAGLTWAMVTKPCGRVGPTIELAAKAANVAAIALDQHTKGCLEQSRGSAF